MNILVSACLLAFNVKYDGKNNAHFLDEKKLLTLKKMANLIPICPEVYGGLSTPRIPCEILNMRVINKDGEDKTLNFEAGAKEALKAAKMFNCSYALLKEKSPSCGFESIYDGTFTHTLVKKNGVTAELLHSNNIKVFGESRIDELIQTIKSINRTSKKSTATQL